ncbi:GNAT family N-acetyltransferase [Thalassotalea euphylliae]|uniref:tRNA(Met) cytidine acetyltransferase n=1 Tax=Thalassotalea euphylliae TaxID=1655234 RepID=A0A3E0UF59_9GAMM|nr:GNAT family N-acetyltransferase [Thalassotalea euphylliae]REL34482.1 tRNA(Met) cytidine acetyltransferase [Thalassotalea euphylliae]
MLETSISKGFTEFSAGLLDARHRGAIFLSGSFSWAVDWYFRHHTCTQTQTQDQLSGQVNKVRQTELGAIFCEAASEPLTDIFCAQWRAFNKLESGDELPINFISSKIYRHHLGRENHAIFFADPAFNLDAFAALSGTLVAGGIMYIWLGDESNIDEAEQVNTSNFLQRLKAYAAAQRGIYHIYQSQTEHAIFGRYSKDESAALGNEEDDEQDRAKNKSSDQFPALREAGLTSDALLPAIKAQATAEQLIAVKYIEKVLTGGRNKPLVLTADRGRGKSTALALATAQLFFASERALNIVITAPHKMALGVYFTQLRKLLDDSQEGKYQLSDHQITWRQHSLTFMAVDELLRSQHHSKSNPDLLLVDEAAGIPVYLLNKLVAQHHRIVFSSTIHGYEGAGKGFTGKFIPMLSAKGLQVKTLTLNEPIRWANHDPLEQLIFNTCLLNASLGELDVCTVKQGQNSSPEYRYFTGDKLAQNEQLLVQVFAILVTAHYQTKPSDLKLLLDDPSITVAVQLVQQQVVAVALLIEEQVVDKALHSAIVSGQRRLKGQLIPQSLAQQSQLPQALEFRYLRVMRIAVHPSAQGLGFGSAFINEIRIFAQQVDIDFVATSFAASSNVVNFWQKNGFTPVKLGFNRDASSGEHSLVMLNDTSLQAAQQKFVQQVSAEFYEALSYWLADEFSQLDYSLVMKLLAIAPKSSLPPITARDCEKLLAFKNNANLYRLARPSIARWLQAYIAKVSVAQINIDHGNVDQNSVGQNNLAQQDKEKLLAALKPMVAKCLMLHQDADICQRFGFTGKKALYQHFQQLIKLS